MKRAFVIAALCVLASGLGAANADAAASCMGFQATIVGTGGNDVLRGTPGHDVIQARAGRDFIHGFEGGDFICAGRGDDVIFAGSARDLVFAGRGSDEIRGGDGNDALSGGRGPDLVLAGRGRDAAGNGALMHFREHGDDVYRLGPGADMCAEVFDPGADQCFGGSGQDTFRLARDDNRLDLYSGGPGDDTVSWDSDEPFYADLTQGVLGALGGVLDTVESVLNVYGSDGADTLIGDGENNRLLGSWGDDHIEGRGGDDDLSGGRGTDFLDGGDESDVCVPGVSQGSPDPGDSVLNCES